ncbi:hypothetical protein CHL78_009735 [Romboutsia weinsteinii]|uniref:Uncharacterized protein n=1 Tax=Romboutsia weinsteinii TaxID=2020949 RepID=A0A371J391_9FIRM|nr:hypothetical protein [Romboutsia weinsteinii]RDY27260.1 hypothetical protein CHL78_009735 [Romboutsia weinsteinii]
MISKIEFCETDNIIIDGESIASYEFEILEKLSESDMSISTKNNNNIDLSKIKLEDRGKQKGMDGPSFG